MATNPKKAPQIRLKKTGSRLFVAASLRHNIAGPEPGREKILRSHHGNMVHSWPLFIMTQEEEADSPRF